MNKKTLMTIGMLLLVVVAVVIYAVSRHRGFRIDGTVYDEAGAVVAGIWVGLVADFRGLAGLEESKAETAAVRVTFTDKNGRYSFRNVSPGVWDLALSWEDDLAENYPVHRVTVDDTRDKATVVFRPYEGELHQLSVSIPSRKDATCWVYRLPRETKFMREGVSVLAEEEGTTIVLTNLYAGNYELYIHMEADRAGVVFPGVTVGHEVKEFHVEEPENRAERNKEFLRFVPVEYEVRIWQDDDVKNVRTFTARTGYFNH